MSLKLDKYTKQDLLVLSIRLQGILDRQDDNTKTYDYLTILNTKIAIERCLDERRKAIGKQGKEEA